MADLPHFARARHEPGKRVAWAMAVVVHVLLAIFLIYGVQWQSSAPEAVSVDLVRYLPPAVADQPAAPPQSQKPPAEPAPPKQEKIVEPPPPPKAEILRKVPEKLKTVKEQVTQKLEQTMAAAQREIDKMTASRDKDADSRKVDRELAQLKAAQSAQSAASRKGLADYVAKVVGKIRGNIILPPAVNGNPESIFVVTQLPSGEVLSVKLQSSSGNRALDEAAERAILKSSPLPRPDDPSLYVRELTIKYRPLED